MLLSGIQDVVNVRKLGRPLHDPENFKIFKGEVLETAAIAGLDDPAIGRNILNTPSRRSASEPKMARNAMDIASIYGGAVVEKGVDVLAKTQDATIPIPGTRFSTIVNVITALLGGGIAIFQMGKREKTSDFFAAFSAAMFPAGTPSSTAETRRQCGPVHFRYQ